MVRVLKHFGLFQPCSTPMQVVAHTHMHTFVVLAGLRRIKLASASSMGDPRVPQINLM